MKLQKNGTIWKDTAGNDIHAHGGHMLRFGEYYYWYGENRIGNNYVSCYRSKDLVSWEFRNNVLTVDSPRASIRRSTDLNLGTENDKVNIERPKVLYNAELGKFVMWAHYENGKNYLDARAAIATCDTPDGDFVYHGSFNPFGYMSRDCTLFEDNGSAYFISASNDNADLHVYRLESDYLDVAEHVNTLWAGEFREAPAPFRKADKLYMLSSFCTGWAPNQGKYSYSDSMDGNFKALEDFGNETTFDSQPAFVLPYEREGDVEYLYFADRWGGKGELYFTSSYIVLPIKFSEDDSAYIEWSDYAEI